MPKRRSGMASGPSALNRALSALISRWRRSVMQRSSQSIGAIAGALAKAQIELANPEKSLTATIRSPFPHEGDRSFRYASLSSGLDLVRKSLGRHEIATVQTTSIDEAAGLIRLTTTLAHSSGEWVASDWPVCSVSETATPHRMGAALTYARRYALFTLVGIAGEDDLDAPDLNGRPQSAGAADVGATSALAPSQRSRRPGGNGNDRGRPTLDPHGSAVMRDQLVHEVASVASAAEAAQWARTALPVKNKLTAADARVVELAFDLRLSAFETEGAARKAGQPSPEAAERLGVSPSSRSTAVAPRNGHSSGVLERSTKPPGIDKSMLPIGEPRRYRDKAHLKFVASQPCLFCGRKPCDPHHLRFAQVRALGRKVSDEFTVPLCRTHHRELHRSGNEFRWWEATGIDPLKIARELWKSTRLNGPV